MEEQTTENRYRHPAELLEEIVNADDFPRGEVSRLEVHCQASGEATWRVWEPGADEARAGYIPAP